MDTEKQRGVEDGGRPAAVPGEPGTALEGRRRLERKTVTVLFADIRESTSLIEDLDPEEAIGLLRPVVQAMAEAVERCGGIVVDELGDGIMALFGAPITQEHHALHACHAALGMLQAVAALDEQPERAHLPAIEIRVGLNSGLVAITLNDDGPDMDFSATGKNVHIAARMESAADPGTTCLTESTYRLVRRHFDCEPLGSRSVKGASGTLRLYRLRGARDAPVSAASPTLGSLYSPFVGRKDKLAHLSIRLDELRKGHGSAVFILGDPGVGKTRMVQELQEGGANDDLLWLAGRTISIGGQLSYWTIIDALHGYLEADRQDGAGLFWYRLQDKITTLFPDNAGEVLPYLATLLGVAEQAKLAERINSLDGEVLKHQILKSVRLLVQRLAADQPVVLVLDDLQWIDGASASVIEHLFSLTLTVPLLIVVTSRREEGEVAAKLRQSAQRLLSDSYSELLLKPLDQRNRSQLLDNLLPLGYDSLRIREMILARTEGNPFFTEEVARALVELEILTFDEATGTWRSQEALDQLAIPESIQGVIMARVDKLDERLKATLHFASVIGRRFFYRVLRSIADDGSSVDESLTELQGHELITENAQLPELEYLFNHALIHEAIYESVSLVNRRKLHASVGRNIEELFSDRLEEVYGLLAYHFVQAQDWEKAQYYLLKALDDARQLAADAEAFRCCMQALEIFQRDPKGGQWDPTKRANIELRLGEIHNRRGESDLALERLRNALSACGQFMPRTRWQFLVGISKEWGRHLLRRSLPASTPTRLYGELSETEKLVIRVWELAVWISTSSDGRALLYGVLRGLNLAHRMGVIEGVSKASAGFGFLLDSIGLSWIGRRYHLQAVELGERAGDPVTTSLAYSMYAGHQVTAGRWAAARTSFENARSLSNSVGDLRVWSHAGVWEGDLLCYLGELMPAMRLAHEIVKQGEETAFAPAVRWGRTMLGGTLRRRGNLVAAESTLRDVLQLCEDDRDFICLCIVAGELGLVLLLLGKTEDSLAVLEEGRRIAVERRVPGYTVTVLLNCLAQHHVTQLGRTEQPDKAVVKAARRACREAMLSARMHVIGRPWALRNKGTLCWLTGNRRGAEDFWTRSKQLAERLGARHDLALTQLELGQRLGRAQDIEAAARLLEEIGADYDRALALEALSQFDTGKSGG